MTINDTHNETAASLCCRLHDHKCMPAGLYQSLQSCSREMSCLLDPSWVHVRGATVALVHPADGIFCTGENLSGVAGLEAHTGRNIRAEAHEA